MVSGSRRERGFTIVELIVVIGVITILAGLLLPALSGVQRRAAKSEELSRIRQVGVAWNLYSLSNQDAALPGYVPPGLQADWDVNYELPVSELDSADGSHQVKKFVDPTDASPWPWRLLPYLDYNQEMVLGHRKYVDSSVYAMSDYGNVSDEIVNVYGYESQFGRRPTEIAYLPSFGYNAFYIGGWWDADVSGFDVTHSLRYSDSNVVARSPSSIRNTTEMVVFCSSSKKEPGSYSELGSQEPGSHYVVPPVLYEQGGEKIRAWQQDTTIGSPEIIEVLDSSGAETPRVPLGRYTGGVAVLYADLRVNAVEPGNLDDQRKWINRADAPTDTHPPDA